MKELFAKLNYKDYSRICILNSDDKFIAGVEKSYPGKQVDREIDLKYLYDFILIFCFSRDDIEDMAPGIMHNLSEDGILWVIYPKKSSKKYSTDISRDSGWESLLDSGLRPVRQVAVDDDLSALRFRNSRFVKSKKQ